MSQAAQNRCARLTSAVSRITGSLGLLAVLLTAMPASAQQVAYVGNADGEFHLTGIRPRRQHRCQGCPRCQGVSPCPTDYVPEGTVVSPDAPLPEEGVESAAPETPDTAPIPDFERFTQPSPSGLASNLGASSGIDTMAPSMIGDFVGTPIAIPISGMVGPNAPVGGAATFSNPFLTRTFKVVEGQSPVPQNRIYGRYNFFDRIDNNDASLSRYVIGFERTIFDSQGSIGLMLPFYAINQGIFDQPTGADPVGPLGFGTNSGSAGDLSAIFKYALYQNPTNGSVFSVGLTITAPTGPSTLAGIRPAFNIVGLRHYGTIQPWFGFLKNFDNSRWFIQNFNAIDQPFDASDATLMFNDLGVGYYFQRDPDALFSAFVPTFEAHATTPLGNREVTITQNPDSGIFFQDTTARLGNQLNLTTGITTLVRRKTALTLGVVVPVVGPTPFDWELQLQLSYFPFGTGRLPGPRFLPN